MKSFLNIILNFFQKNGIFKIIVSFLLLALFVNLYNRTHSNIFNYLAIIPIAYLVITFLLFLVTGIINTIKDFKKK